MNHKRTGPALPIQVARYRLIYAILPQHDGYGDQDYYFNTNYYSLGIDKTRCSMILVKFN